MQRTAATAFTWGSESGRLRERLDTIGIDDWAPAGNPVVFWNLFGKLGHPVRTTVSEIGPTLLSRVHMRTSHAYGVPRNKG